MAAFYYGSVILAMCIVMRLELFASGEAFILNFLNPDFSVVYNNSTVVHISSDTSQYIIILLNGGNTFLIFILSFFTTRL